MINGTWKLLQFAHYESHIIKRCFLQCKLVDMIGCETWGNTGYFGKEMKWGRYCRRKSLEQLSGGVANEISFKSYPRPMELYDIGAETHG